MKLQKNNQAKRLVMQPLYRQRVVRDETRYLRNVKHKKASVFGGFFMCLVMLFTLIGCQSNPVVSTQGLPATQHTAPKMKKGAVDYAQIIRTSRLNELIAIEQYGIHEVADQAGYIDSIRLRIKFIGLDDASGKKMVVERPSLDTFLSGISTLFSAETGAEIQKIELIAQVGGCQAHVLAGNVQDVKCNKAPVKAAGSDDIYLIKVKDSIQQYNECKNAGGNDAFCLKYAASSGTVKDTSVLTQDKLKQFCVEVLSKKFAKHDFASACEIVHNATERYFMIEDIHTKGYITDGYWERFTIRLSYLYGKNAGQEFIGDLKLADGKCVARIILRGKRPDTYEDPLTQCGKQVHEKILRLEDGLADWFNQYFAEKKAA